MQRSAINLARKHSVDHGPNTDHGHGHPPRLRLSKATRGWGRGGTTWTLRLLAPASLGVRPKPCLLELSNSGGRVLRRCGTARTLSTYSRASCVYLRLDECCVSHDSNLGFGGTLATRTRPRR